MKILLLKRPIFKVSMFALLIFESKNLVFQANQLIQTIQRQQENLTLIGCNWPWLKNFVI